MQKHLKGTLAVILAVVLITVAVPFGAFARTVETAPLTIGVMSDTHYYPRSLMPAEDDEKGWETFSKFCRVKGKQFPQTGGLVDAALAAMAEDVREKGLKYVLIPGDLTKDSEIEAHKGLAAKLEQFEKDTGAQVLSSTAITISIITMPPLLRPARKSRTRAWSPRRSSLRRFTKTLATTWLQPFIRRPRENKPMGFLMRSAWRAVTA